VAPQDNQLMSQHRILGFKPELLPEWRGQDGQSEAEQPDHHTSLGDSNAASHADEVFGTHRLRNYWKSANFRTLPDATLEKLTTLAGTMPTYATDILISQLGGAISDVPDDAAAFPHRDAAFIVTPGVRWEDTADDARCFAWMARRKTKRLPSDCPSISGCPAEQA